MKVFVAIEKNSLIPRAYGSMKAVSDDLNIPYHKLLRVFGRKKEDVYSEYGIDIRRVMLIKKKRTLKDEKVLERSKKEENLARLRALVHSFEKR